LTHLCLLAGTCAQGQGGGLPPAEWTLASVLKEAGYNTYFSGKVGGVGRGGQEGVHGG